MDIFRAGVGKNSGGVYTGLAGEEKGERGWGVLLEKDIKKTSLVNLCLAVKSSILCHSTVQWILKAFG